MTKKINYLFTVVFSVMMLVLAGCQNNITGTIEGANSGKKLLVALTTNYTKTGARYIGPDDWSSTELAGLTFHLNGSSLRGDVYDADVTFDGDLKGKVELTYDVWDLELTAKKGDELVLKGSTYTDLSNGGSSIKFFLSPNGILENGAIDISGTYTEPKPAEPVANIYKINLLDFNTRATVQSLPYVANPANTQVSIQMADVPAGLYLLEVRFYKDTKTVGYWSDAVRVVPGKTTSKTDVDFGTMKQAPDAPSGLQVTNVAGSDSEFGTYQVELAWTDESNNEENFVIYVYTYDAWNGTPTLLKQLDTAKTDTTKKVSNLKNDPMYVDGGILAGNTSVTLELDTGVIYDFEVSAKNFVGESAKCAREASVDYDATGTENIARTMITYNLNGGTYTLANSTVYDGDAIYEFHKYEGTNIPVMTIPTDAKLELNEYPFSKWADGSSADATEVTETDGVNDLNVFALYLTETEISFEVETFENKLAAAKVSAVDKASADVKNGTVDVKSVAGQQITFSVTDDTFDYYQVRINEKTVFKGKVSDSYVLDNFTTYNSGDYNVLVLARNKENKNWYGDQFKITIAR